MLAAVGPPALLNVAANILLLPRFGMMAAAWTTVGSYMLAIVLSVALGRRHVRTPFPPRAAGRTLVACLPLALALLGRNDDSPVGLAWICAGLVSYAVSLSALVWFAAGRSEANRRTG
jgi:O-antigen/teichoic acid export membrane protein